MATIEEVASRPLPEPAPETAPPRRPRSPFGTFRRTAGGVGAVGVKELRGRMRGRRAFVIISLYLVLLAGFAWMVELIMERTYATGFGGNATFATAAIGQGIFVSILMLETLLVAFLAPMATAGAISLEREKQTLEMLAATPITSVAIVIGKLLSALIYVWLLIAASIPLTAVVFVFGGVAPDDLLHGYLVLIVTALGLGAFGLLCSSLVKRTQAASAITIFGVLALSIGSLFVILFWQALASADQGRGTGPIKGSPPAPLIFLNPFLAQADVAPTDALCGTSSALQLLLRFQGDLPARPERCDLRQRLRHRTRRSRSTPSMAALFRSRSTARPSASIPSRSRSSRSWRREAAEGQSRRSQAGLISRWADLRTTARPSRSRSSMRASGRRT